MDDDHSLGFANALPDLARKVFKRVARLGKDQELATLAGFLMGQRNSQEIAALQSRSIAHANGDRRRAVEMLAAALKGFAQNARRSGQQGMEPTRTPRCSRQAPRWGVVMARKDHETIARLIGLATAAAGGNKRRAARLLFDGFTAIVTDSTASDQRWGSEICGNASVTLYPYPDEAEDTAERPVH